jgi:hypothetical protein
MSKLSTWTHCTKFYENDPAELIHLFEMYFQACGFQKGENIAILSWTVVAAAQGENIHDSWSWLQDLGMKCFLQILCWWRLSNCSRSVLFAATYEHLPHPRAHLQHKGFDTMSYSKMLAALLLPLHHTWYSPKSINPESHTQFRILMSKMMYQMIIMRQIFIL